MAAAPTLERVSSPDQAPVPEPSLASPPRRIRIRRVSADGVWSLLVSLAGAAGLVWVLYQRVLPLSGAAGMWLVGYVTFLGLYALIGWGQWPMRTVTDRLVTVVCATAAISVLLVVLAQVVFVIDRGSRAIGHGNFWTQTLSRTGPLDPLTSGGMVHALVGSLEQLGVSTLLAVPIGIIGALYLVEMDDWFVRPVRIIVQSMTALPEIIAGLFIYVTVVLGLGAGFSGFAASLALAVMMVPIVTRTAEVVLRLVPAPLREASYALGSSHFRTVWNVVLPTNLSNLNGCNNPTYHNGVNYLVKDAPYPTACDKVGAPLNCVPAHGGGFNNAGAASSNGGSKSGGGAAATRAAGGGSASSSAPSGGASAHVVVDPVTGATETPGARAAGNSSAVYAQPVSVSGSAGAQGIYGVLAAIEILAAVLVPGSLGIWLSRRRRPQ